MLIVLWNWLENIFRWYGASRFFSAIAELLVLLADPNPIWFNVITDDLQTTDDQDDNDNDNDN